MKFRLKIHRPLQACDRGRHVLIITLRVFARASRANTRRRADRGAYPELRTPGRHYLLKFALYLKQSYKLQSPRCSIQIANGIQPID